MAVRAAWIVVSLLAAASAAAAQQNPAANEQLLIYEVNRARQNPQRYAGEQGLGALLDGIAPAPPLAVNGNLVQSAGFHAEEMAANNYFAHYSPVSMQWPNQMAINAGYPLPWPGDQNFIESLAAGYSNVQTALRGLLEDLGVSPPGHRYHLLATGPSQAFWLSHREIGTGFGFNMSSTYQRYYAIHTAVRSAGPTLFLTGVVYNDANANGRFDLNEGLGGVTVSAGAAMTTTNPAGGWSIPIAAGGHTVTATGGGFSGTSTATVSVSSANVEIDFESGTPAGEVNFANQGGAVIPPVSGGGGGGGDDDGCGSLGLDLLLPLVLLRRRGRRH